MVSVKIEYYKRKVTFLKSARVEQTHEDDLFIYKSIEVTGHCNAGKSWDNLVCSAISAIVAPIEDMLFLAKYQHCKCNRGEFYYNDTLPFINKLRDISIQEQVRNMLHLDTIVFQLYNLYCNYPSEFNCFQMIDIEKGEE